MIMTRAQLTDAVQAIATTAALNSGLKLTQAALGVLTDVPPPFVKDSYDIDPDKLRDTVTPIVASAIMDRLLIASLASSPAGSDELQDHDVREALNKSECHYLWFC